MNGITSYQFDCFKWKKVVSKNITKDKDRSDLGFYPIFSSFTWKIKSNEKIATQANRQFVYVCVCVAIALLSSVFSGKDIIVFKIIPEKFVYTTKYLISFAIISKVSDKPFTCLSSVNLITFLFVYQSIPLIIHPFIHLSYLSVYSAFPAFKWRKVGVVVEDENVKVFTGIPLSFQQYLPFNS